MGYMNPVLQFGFEKFCQRAAETGIDGLILPDLPPFEYENEYKAIVEKNKLDLIFLVTPETTDERIIMLDQLSTGFLYAVSSSSTTGSGKNPATMESYLKRLSRLHLKNPVLVGFGIGDKTAFDIACRHAGGAVLGSAYIKTLGSAEKPDAATKRFVSSILG
ncbi:MAG TPA: tryptophan synthase subunit alpha, partial [Chitinophagaceae bacterium]|nr:tryptophan synthase subunit alpha [Chitinophagaceae bacterium]